MLTIEWPIIPQVTIAECQYLSASGSKLQQIYRTCLWPVINLSFNDRLTDNSNYNIQSQEHFQLEK